MTAPALSIQQLRKHYKKGDVDALAGIDLEIPSGAFFGLLGRNGAGKSTLIGLITGTARMQSGRISVFGYDNQQQAIAAKRCMGIVPQEVNFNSFEPVSEIITSQGMYYGLSYAQAKRCTDEVLEQVGLAAKAKGKAFGLSGGMKRRLMIARALVHQPRLLILDEPSAGLDVEARQATWSMLQDLNKAGTSILLTTHYLEEAEALCDEVAVIEAGQIIARDKPQTLLAGLHSQHLILDLASPLNSPPILSCGHIRAWSAQQLEVDWPSPTGLDALFAELAQQGVGVLGMSNGSNRLEARFLELLAERAKA